MSTIKNLVQIIRENPGAIAEIDNDGWSLYSANWNNPPDFGDQIDQDDWVQKNTLVTSADQIESLEGTSYGDNDTYGTAILLACAQIAGIKVTSV